MKLEVFRQNSLFNASNQLIKKNIIKMHDILRRPDYGTAVVLAAIFAILVAFGFTGSSLTIGMKQSGVISKIPEHIAGSAQGIRSDEYVVSTPLAIGQTTHRPPFPIINQNLGEDGQNMLIVGGVGVPVKHLSAFAKPATWGFHIFDLKHALAWLWWFPIFGCLYALWWLFCLLSPGNWRMGLFVAIWFCLSPYVVAWSNVPAYAVFFPSLSLCLAVQILRTNNAIRLAALSLLLGLSVAGFALILYPPWQIPLGFLFLAITAGIVVRDKLYKCLNLRRGGGICGRDGFVWMHFAGVVQRCLSCNYRDD